MIEESIVEEFYEFLDARGLLFKFIKESDYKIVDLTKMHPYHYVSRSYVPHCDFWQRISLEWRDYLTYWKEELEAE